MAISIGIVIGVGIFRVPAEVAKCLPSGPLILLAWLVGGLISLMGALCYAELSATFPETGGDYVYLRNGYGKLVAFLYAWTQLTIIRTGSIATISYLFADYACGLLSVTGSWAKPLAVGVISILALVNLAGLNYGRIAQNLLTLAKLSALLFLVVCGLLSGKGEPSRLTALADVSINIKLISSFLLALIPVLWTYGGWQESVFVAGETREARKSLPFALLGTVAVVGSAYMCVNALLLYLLPPEKIAASPLIAADVLDLLYGGLSGKLLEALVVLYSIGSVNAMIITGSRVTYAMAQDFPLFQFLARTDGKTNTPTAALLLNAVGSCIFVMLGSFDRLLFFTGIAVWLFFALVVACVFIFRLRQPQVERPFIVPLYPWLPACFLLACTGLCLNTLLWYPQQSILGLALVASGAPVYYLSQSLSRRGTRRHTRDEI